MAFDISDTFLLEDVTDPVAINVFSNTTDCDLCNDLEDLKDEYEDSLEDVFGEDEEYFDGEDGMVTYSSGDPDELIDYSNCNLLDDEVNEEILADNDLAEMMEDNELIDIVDGLI